MAATVQNSQMGDSPMIVKATLIKLKTDDGLVEFSPGIEVGREYIVDLNSIRRDQTLMHFDIKGASINHRKDLIWTWDGQWLPMECLKIAGVE